MNSLMKWRPTYEFMPLRFGARFWDRDLDELWEDFVEAKEEEGVISPPRVESYRKNGNYVIKADLPGVEAKDIQVTLENGCLTIKGERKKDREVKEKNLERREVFYGSFVRSLPVPEGLKTEKIKAKYHDGVLEISAPVEDKFLPKKIEVEEGKS